LPTPHRLHATRDAQVILFHKFFSQSETDAFIRHGKGRYEKSLGVGMKEDGTMGDVKTEIRTSSHGWCQHPACLNDPDVQRVVARVSDVTQTPATNAEFAQLVYYHACPSPDDPSCAFYRRHNDYIDGDEHKLQGVRIYTLFGYMNDVPDGGGTRFTSLPSGPVTFQPQRGKAILWPSVLADDPHSKDERTDHEALPVTAGTPPGLTTKAKRTDSQRPRSCRSCFCTPQVLSCSLSLSLPLHPTHHVRIPAPPPSLCISAICLPKVRPMVLLQHTWQVRNMGRTSGSTSTISRAHTPGAVPRAESPCGPVSLVRPGLRLARTRN